MENRTKLYLLTGFLGAGKTTFLTNVLNDLEGKKVAVIMNEFGKVGIDGSIIQKDGMELVEINRGSIFCSCLQLSFVSALTEMADRNMEYVIVESLSLIHIYGSNSHTSHKFSSSCHIFRIVRSCSRSKYSGVCS